MKQLFGFINKLPPRTIFLGDACGALFTTVLLGLVLIHWSEYFGFGKDVFRILAAIAFAYFIYSSTIYLSKPKNWPPYLRVIALANLFYVALTLSLLFVLRDKVTLLGYLYFISEAFLIAGIAVLEWRYSSRGIGRPFSPSLTKDIDHPII